MPYYKGRWHLYDERERREYGERKRQEHSQQWHATWISRQGLKDRLWTDKAITTFLPTSQKAGPIRAWRRENVLAIEKTAAFKAWMEERRVWLDARCLLPDISYATYGLLAIGWDRRAPEKPVRYQKLVWNENRQALTDFSRQWHNSPFTGAEFGDQETDEVACMIFEWFLRQHGSPSGNG